MTLGLQKLTWLPTIDIKAATYPVVAPTVVVTLDMLEGCLVSRDNPLPGLSGAIVTTSFPVKDQCWFGRIFGHLTYFGTARVKSASASQERCPYAALLRLPWLCPYSEAQVSHRWGCGHGFRPRVITLEHRIRHQLRRKDYGASQQRGNSGNRSLVDPFQTHSSGRWRRP